MAICMAVFLASRYLLGMLRGRLRAELAVLIVVFFCWLYRFRYEIYYHYLILGVFVVIYGLRSHRIAVAPPPYHLTVRELIYGDANAERQRLIEKLHLAMLQETDLAVRHAYAESIVALKRKLPSGSKVVE
jgi:hypothetical protein